MKQSPAERLFTLTCYLLSTEIKGLSKQDIFRAVPGYQDSKTEEAANRLFERDKTSLKEAGIQLEVISNFGFEDAVAARYRIANTDLTPFTPRLLTRHPAFSPLARAIDSGNQVAFRYQKPDGSLSDRIVSPQSLRQIEGQWVLLAVHEGQTKNFLLRRIVSEVTISEAETKRLTLAELQQVEQELNDFVQGNLATIKVTGDTEAQLALNPGEDGIAKINFMDEALLAEDLLEFGADVEVIEPESLKRRIRASLKAVIKQHA